MQSDRTCSPACSGRGGMRSGDLARPAVGPGDEPLPPRPDRRRGPGPGRRRGPGRAPAAGPSDHRQRRPSNAADQAAAVRPALAADLPGALRWPLSAGRHRVAEAQGKAAPSAPAPAAAASGAQASVLPSGLPPFPLPYPRRAPAGITTASTADNRWSEAPSRGVARKTARDSPALGGAAAQGRTNEGALRARRSGPPTPGGPRSMGLGVRVYGTPLGIDP
jgi:hypothetical protein